MINALDFIAARPDSEHARKFAETVASTIRDCKAHSAVGTPSETRRPPRRMTTSSTMKCVLVWILTCALFLTARATAHEPRQDKVREPRHAQDGSRVAAGGNHRPLNSVRPGLAHQRDGGFVDAETFVLECSEEIAVLPLAETVYRFLPRIVVRRPLGQPDATRREKVPDAGVAGLAVNVGTVVRRDVERHEQGPPACGFRGQMLIEECFPCRGVQPGRARNHPVEIE